jgi:hypothetical protein
LTDVPPPQRTGRRGRVKKTKQQNLIYRLLRHEESVLAFVHVFTVPFDNNLAQEGWENDEAEREDKRHLPLPRGRPALGENKVLYLHRPQERRECFREIRNALEGNPFEVEWR